LALGGIAANCGFRPKISPSLSSTKLLVTSVPVKWHLIPSNALAGSTSVTHIHTYTVSHKKQDNKLLSITSPNIDRFSQLIILSLLHSQEICNKNFITDPPHVNGVAILPCETLPSDSIACRICWRYEQEFGVLLLTHGVRTHRHTDRPRCGNMCCSRRNCFQRCRLIIIVIIIIIN